MSLINKMLQDLETRDRADAGATSGSALNGLRSVHDSPRTSMLPRLIVASLLLALGIGAGVYYFSGSSGEPGSINVAAQAIDKESQDEPRRTRAVAPAKVDLQPMQRLKEVTPPAPAPPEAKTRVIPEEPSAAVTRKPAAPAKPPAAKKIETPRTPVVARVEEPSQAPVQSAAPAPAQDAVVEKFDRPVSPQEQAEARYRQAANQVARGRGEEARANLNAALSAFPAHHKARELAAALALQNGRLQEAQELLTQGLGLAPARLSFAKLLSRTYLEQGSEASAIATLEGVRAGAGDDADFLSLLAALYQRSARHTEAVAAYREVLAARAQDARAWLGLGISLDSLQDAAAGDAYTRALQLGLDSNLAQYARQRLAVVKK